MIESMKVYKVCLSVMTMFVFLLLCVTAGCRVFSVEIDFSLYRVGKWRHDVNKEKT